MRRGLCNASTVTAMMLLACAMPNPEWTASSSAGDPTTSDATATTGSTTMPTTATTVPTTATTDVPTTATEPTASTDPVTTDPTFTSTSTSTSTTSTSTSTSSTSTSTSTGELQCEDVEFADEGPGLELRLKKGQDLLLEGFPLVNCDAVPFFWAGGPAFEDEALKLVPGGPCPGGNMDLTLELNGNFPSGYTPGGGTTCATIYIYLAEDPDNNNACTRITGFELREFQGSQELYLAMGSGRAEMDVALSGKVELESTLECVDNGEMCAPFAAGGYKLAHTFIDEHPPIEPGVWTEDGGDFELFNDRSHIHGSLDEEGCTPHLDWVLRRAK